MRSLSVAVLLLSSALLAGCGEDGSGPSSSSNPPPPYDYAALEQDIGEPIDDAGWVPTAPASYNLERIVDLTGAPGRTPLPVEGYVETLVKNGYAYLCRSGIDEALVIFDVHDIENASYVGEISLNAGFEADIEVSDDGNWAFWETQRIPGLGAPDPLNPTSVGGALPYGIHIIDISNKAAPRWAGFTPVPPNGPHSISYANIGGVDYVFASVYSWQYVGTSVGTPTLAPPGMQRLLIYRLDTSLPVAQLTQVAEYIDPDATEESPIMPRGGLMPHDVSISRHPITNDTLAYIAYWDVGVVILNVNDPANPIRLSRFADFGPADYEEIHMARAFPTLIAGRVVGVAEPELTEGQLDSGYMTFFDATDPTAPYYLSSWEIPGFPRQGGGPHYFDAQYGRVILAHYSNGFWVIDVHNEENLMDPKTVGYAQQSGSAFDAWWADNTHVVASEGDGLAIFRYTGPAPMPVTEAAPAAATAA